MSEPTVSLTLHLGARDEALQAYPVTAALGEGDHFSGGELRLDAAELRQHELEPEEYGLLLFESLFAGRIRRAYDRAIGRLSAEGRLRVRLLIDDAAPELHARPWERLYHYQGGAPVPMATSAQTPLARAVRLDMPEPAPVTERPLRLLVAISNPTDPPEGFAPVTVEAEVASLLETLPASGVRAAFLPGRTGLSPELARRVAAAGHQVLAGPTTLDALARHWGDSHLFHFIGHGAVRGTGGTSVAQLLLEKPDGAWRMAPDGEIAARLAATGRWPQVAFFVACQSARRDPVHAFVGLAPQLLHAGFPAVVAMQSNVPMKTAQGLAAEFYRRLLEHGEVDLALNQARAAVFDPRRTDWAIPALYLRRADGKLFAEPPTPAAQATPTGGARNVTASHGGVAVGGNVYGNISTGGQAPPEPPRGLRDAYLSSLIEQVRAVPLAGVDPKSIREETRHDLELAAVYTALLTRRAEPEAELGGARGAKPDRSESRALSALEVLNTEKALAMLGEPGSGKSTFVNFVALCLAGEALGLKDANLAALTRPPPREDRPARAGKDTAPQPWDHGALLPVRVILREFVARGLPPLDKPAPVGGDTLWKFITAELPETLKDFAGPLRDELLSRGGLLLLDGLDEVPEASQRREQVKTAVEKFTAAFPRVRVLVTSRTYAYQNQAWKLAGFVEVVLAPFGPAQIDGFVERWYAFVGQARRLTPDDIRGRAAALRAAIRRSASLRELAARPLLLTLMASLHAWRGGALPEDREALFADAVDLLLDQWESQKLRRGPDGRPEVAEPGLAEWLRVDHKAVRSALNRLAFEVHRAQPTLTGTADIAEKALLDALLALNPDCRPGPLVKFISTRTGLLEPRGVGVYAFPHRTFQEYLAACHLTERDDFPENVAGLARAEPNRWREVALLAGVKAARGAAANAWALAESFCPEEPPAERAGDEAGYWGALLAAQSLLETRSLEKVAERNRSKVARLRGWLVRTLEHGALPPVDRAQAGDALAALGDPRFRPEAWFLADEALLGFVEIPAGPFTMGSAPEHDSDAADDEQPQHPVTLPGYFIGRYPVTVAQFGAFVQASGYRRADPSWQRDPANRPVRNVTWHDALAYCDWLTGTLKNWAETPPELARLLHQEGWRVTLPSEAEWEKAARGPSTGSGPARVYPWGDELDARCANIDETGLGTTSAVGMLPGGRSPHGVLDLSGNVWEWTRSLWGKDWQKPEFGYPYDPTDSRREDLNAPDSVHRVLRGGSFDYDRRLARCASRLRYPPVIWLDYLGFRCVVSPLRL